MPLTKFSQQLRLMKKIMRVFGSLLLLLQLVLLVILNSNPDLKPFGGYWYYLVLSGFAVFQYFYFLQSTANPKESKIIATAITIAALWLSAIILLLFEPLKHIPSSQIAVMVGFMVINYRLWLQDIKQLTIPFKLYSLTTAALFIISVFLLINADTIPKISDFIRLKVSVHSILILLLIALDRFVIDLFQNEKQVQLKIANEKNLELKSELLNEVDKQIHKPLGLLHISLESLRLNSFGESREIASNGIKQLVQIDKYLGSITKVNKLKGSEKVATNRVITEISLAYKDWISVESEGIPENNFMNQSEIFALRTLLDFAINNKSKYCALDASIVNSKLKFEITFDGPGLTDAILKLNLKEGFGRYNEAYDLKLAFRLLRKEGYAIMISNQLLQGSRFLIICEDADISKFELPGKINTIVQ